MAWRVTLGSCSLGADELAVRQAAWARLDVHRVAGTAVPGGFELRYSPVPGVAEDVGRLAIAEGGCCGFADWRVEPGDDHVLLVVTGPEPGIGELREAFRISPASAGGGDDRR